MIEVFGKKPVTSREFPAVLFDAGGTLMHFTPALDRFYKDQLALLGFTKTQEDIEVAWLKMLSQLNKQVESDAHWVPRESFWIRAFLSALELPEDKLEDVAASLTNSSKALRWVISSEVVNLCETLKERGYQLGVVSNAQHELSEIFRVQGLLDLFDIVLTAGSSASRQKPQPEMFLEAADDLDIPPEQMIHVGESFALDVIGAQRAGLKAVLYDPTYREVKALAETTNESFSKVVSIETIRQNRRLSGVRLVSKIEDLGTFFL